MPRKNGFECLAEIKALTPYKDIPVIMYSNSARLQELEKAYQYGAALYIKKPSAYTDLIQALQEVLQKNWNEVHNWKGMYFYKGAYHAAEA
jgi:CheY-like chemotaxis protein